MKIPFGSDGGEQAVSKEEGGQANETEVLDRLKHVQTHKVQEVQEEDGCSGMVEVENEKGSHENQHYNIGVDNKVHEVA